MKYFACFMCFVLLPLQAFCEEEVILDAGVEWRMCPQDKPIKGNVNFVKNTKIYHLPEGNFYKRTNPEACFSSVQEAENAGFRKSSK